MGSLMHPLTQVAAANPHAWFPTERSAQELVTTSPLNRNDLLPLRQIPERGHGHGAGSRHLDCFGSLRGSNRHSSGQARLLARRRLRCRKSVEFQRAPVIRSRARHEDLPYDRTLERRPRPRRDRPSSTSTPASLSRSPWPANPSASTKQTRGVSRSQAACPTPVAPESSYSFHSLATAVERLQAGAAKNAMVTGNGWYLTKHSASVLSLEPNSETPDCSRKRRLSARPSSGEPVVLDKAPEGNATVETYTIGHGRDGSPEKGLIVGRLGLD